MADFIIAKSVTDLTTPLSTVANADTVTFAEGSQTVNAGLTVTAQLNQLAILPAFTGTIGGGSGSFDVAVGGASAGTNPRTVYAAGGGSLYLGRSGATYTRVQAIGRGSMYLTNGTVTTLEQRSGVVSVNGSTIVTNAYVQGGEFSCLNNATAITDAVVSGGVANFQRSVTTLKIAGRGIANVYRDDTTASMPTATTIEAGGGLLKWRGGNITTLRAWGDAMLDFSAVAVPITITNLIIDHAVWERSVLRSASRVGVVTITNTTIYASERDTV